MSSFRKTSLSWLALTMSAALLPTAVNSELVLGNFIDRAHDLVGEVVALSDRVLEVRGFGYDGDAPDAFFWADTSATPTENGFILQDGAPSNNCGQVKLGFADGTVTYRVEFPTGTTLMDIAGGSISVWCRAFGANFGELVVPDMATLEGLKSAAEGPELQCSTLLNEISLGTFRDLAHDIAGEVVALSDRVLEVRGFGYDGTAPDAFFWADASATPSENGFILSDGAPSNGCGQEKLGFADGTETYRVEFPEGTSLRNITGGSISVWCRAFGANFGDLVVPDDAALDGLATTENGPALQCSEGGGATGYEEKDITETPEGYNCESLHEDFQVRWKVDGDELAVELVGFIGETDYMGFGISGHDNRTEMVGADVVIGDLFQGEFRAVDFYMSARAQCSSGSGVCPDMGDFNNSVSSVSGDRDVGITVVRFRRPLMATDSDLVNGATVDRNISVVPGEQTFIAWALGPVSEDTGFPNFHTIAFPREDVSLDFGRPVADNCEPLVDMDDGDMMVDAFEVPVLRGVTELRASIGPSGGDRGYFGITGGRVGWGISWYINDYLLPVIEMERGTTYTFVVNGGDVPTDSANYHPMYLTTSISGGYAQIGDEERAEETIFGGLTVFPNNSSFDPTVAGPICKFEATDATAQAMVNGTYEEFFATLDSSCQDDVSITGNAAILEFTPDENTPDLLYYQCVTHRNLGWEIRVVNPGETYNESETETAITRAGSDSADLKEEGSLRGAADSAGSILSFGWSALIGAVAVLML